MKRKTKKKATKKPAARTRKAVVVKPALAPAPVLGTSERMQACLPGPLHPAAHRAFTAITRQVDLMALDMVRIRNAVEGLRSEIRTQPFAAPLRGAMSALHTEMSGLRAEVETFRQEASERGVAAVNELRGHIMVMPGEPMVSRKWWWPWR